MRILPPVVIVLLAAFVSVVSADPADLEVVGDHVDRAMYRTAFAELAEILGTDGENAAAWALLCRCRIATADSAGALEAASKAATLDAETPEYWLLLGRTLILGGLDVSQAGRPKEIVDRWFRDAEAKFRHYQGLRPEDPESVWRIGQAREWTGDTGTARQFYELAIEKYPDCAAGYARLGELLLSRSGRTKDAAAARRLREEAYVVFEAGLEGAGEDGEILCLYAGSLETHGEKENALDLYLRAAVGDPEYEKSWVRASKLGDPAKVLLPVAVEVLSDHPKAAEAAWWAGHLTNRRDPAKDEESWHKHREALRLILPALAEHGDHDGLYTEAFRAAQVLLGSNPKAALDAKTGTDAFRRIHEAYRWSGDAANNLGFFYREARKYDLSLAWYLKSVERAPENQDILNDTGLIYLFHFPSEKAKGLPYFLKTVALVSEGDQDPERGYWDALENLCKHYWEVDRQPEKVIEYARMRYLKTKGVPPYNMSKKAEKHADLAKKALGR